MPQPEEVDRLTNALREEYRRAWDKLRIAEQELLDKPTYWRERARLNALQDRVDGLMDELDDKSLRWYSNEFPKVYELGYSRSSQRGIEWTLIHREAVEQLATDGYGDLLGATQYVRADTKRQIRAVTREAAAMKLLGGQTALGAAADARRRLEESGIAAVTYKDGSRHGLREYANMALRTKTATAYNVGTLNAHTDVKFFQVFDGLACGLTSHSDVQMANGLILTREECEKYIIAHPNCRRAFGPRPDLKKRPTKMSRLMANRTAQLVAKTTAKEVAKQVVAPYLQRRLETLLIAKMAARRGGLWATPAVARSARMVILDAMVQGSSPWKKLVLYRDARLAEIEDAYRDFWRLDPPLALGPGKPTLALPPARFKALNPAPAPVPKVLDQPYSAGPAPASTELFGKWQIGYHNAGAAKRYDELREFAEQSVNTSLLKEFVDETLETGVVEPQLQRAATNVLNGRPFADPVHDKARVLLDQLNVSQWTQTDLYFTEIVDDLDEKIASQFQRGLITLDEALQKAGRPRTDDVISIPLRKVTVMTDYDVPAELMEAAGANVMYRFSKDALRNVAAISLALGVKPKDFATDDELINYLTEQIVLTGSYRVVQVKPISAGTVYELEFVSLLPPEQQRDPIVLGAVEVEYGPPAYLTRTAPAIFAYEGEELAVPTWVGGTGDEQREADTSQQMTDLLTGGVHDSEAKVQTMERLAEAWDLPFERYLAFYDAYTQARSGSQVSLVHIFTTPEIFEDWVVTRQSELDPRLKRIDDFRDNYNTANEFKLNDPIFKTLLVNKLVSDLVNEWASSSTNSVGSFAMQLAAREEFGLDAAWDPASGRMNMHADVVDRGTVLYEEMEQELRWFVRVMYEQSQEALRDAGITRVLLHRGVTDRPWHVEDQVHLRHEKRELEIEGPQLQPMSSFATTRSSASGFFDQSRGAMFHTLVPAERIIGFPRYGFGCLSEDEVVVLDTRGFLNVKMGTDYEPPVVAYVLTLRSGEWAKFFNDLNEIERNPPMLWANAELRRTLQYLSQYAFHAELTQYDTPLLLSTSAYAFINASRLWDKYQDLIRSPRGVAYADVPQDLRDFLGIPAGAPEEEMWKAIGVIIPRLLGLEQTFEPEFYDAPYWLKSDAIDGKHFVPIADPARDLAALELQAREAVLRASEALNSAPPSPYVIDRIESAISGVIQSLITRSATHPITYPQALREIKDSLSPEVYDPAAGGYYTIASGGKVFDAISETFLTLPAPKPPIPEAALTQEQFTQSLTSGGSTVLHSVTSLLQAALSKATGQPIYDIDQIGIKKFITANILGKHVVITPNDVMDEIMDWYGDTLNPPVLGSSESKIVNELAEKVTKTMTLQNRALIDEYFPRLQTGTLPSGVKIDSELVLKAFTFVVNKQYADFLDLNPDQPVSSIGGLMDEGLKLIEKLRIAIPTGAGDIAIEAANQLVGTILKFHVAGVFDADAIMRELQLTASPAAKALAKPTSAVSISTAEVFEDQLSATALGKIKDGVNKALLATAIDADDGKYIVKELEKTTSVTELELRLMEMLDSATTMDVLLKTSIADAVYTLIHGTDAPPGFFSAPSVPTLPVEQIEMTILGELVKGYFPGPGQLSADDLMNVIGSGWYQLGSISASYVIEKVTIASDKHGVPDDVRKAIINAIIALFNSLG